MTDEAKADEPQDGPALSVVGPGDQHRRDGPLRDPDRHGPRPESPHETSGLRVR
ncbi:hypothetical protein [Streptomyces sp. NPDC055992]|uniref:hypothetical protein n=1 Tax=Streptomyces sp. NPDC055992 TaxID=3345673 RepID=UPI0035D620C3